MGSWSTGFAPTTAKMPTTTIADALCNSDPAYGELCLSPAEGASLSILHLAALVNEAGLPAGTVNVVTQTAPQRRSPR